MMPASKVLLGILTITNLIACAPREYLDASSPIPTNSEISEIINGQPVLAGHELLKSVVAVYNIGNSQLCTGALLPDNVVLTAAHCVSPNEADMYIAFATSVTSDAQFRAVDKVKISDYWENQRNQNKDTGDIAVMHFLGDIPEGYTPVSLLPSLIKLKANQETLILGFGFNNGVTKEGAGVLRWGQVKIADPYFSPSEIKLDQTGGTGACHGDSGGPAYVKLGNKYFLWGIASRGVDDPHNNCSQYSAYTSIQYYRAWIDRTAGAVSRSLTRPFNRSRYFW